MTIPGLQYLPNYLDEDREATLLDRIDAQPWLGDLKRRVQHYGYKYNYKARSVDPSMYLGSLPDWAASLAEGLHANKLFSNPPDQLIVNEYQPGQGISAHVDCEPCFDNTIASITLGAGCMMDFTSVQDGSKISRYLEPRSIVILAGEARYEWRHAIANRKSDVCNVQRVLRGRRVSLTFRNVLVKPYAPIDPPS